MGKVYGVCNCGKKATSEYLVFGRNFVTTTKYCDGCQPKYKNENLIHIYGKRNG